MGPRRFLIVGMLSTWLVDVSTMLTVVNVALGLQDMPILETGPMQTSHLKKTRTSCKKGAIV